MTLINPTVWKATTGFFLVASATAFTVWWVRRRQPTADEIERERRFTLAHSGRLVDGMLLDVREINENDRTLTFLEYSYRIGGVDYECSQDITTIADIVRPAEVRVGFPCSVRYHQHQPQNSIVVAESWTGLRDSLPELPRLGRSHSGQASQQGSMPPLS